MTRTDWRSPDAYEDLRSLDAPGFAWEYLRRNPEFQRDQSKLERAARGGALDSAEEEAFTRRWGVRFRGRRPGREPLCAVGAARFAERHLVDKVAC